MGTSVRARLLNLAKASGQSFDLVLTRFALERLLFRLSQSRYADRFVLKGAMLLMSWLAEPHRGTRDLDLLGFGDPSADAMLATFREILAQNAGYSMRMRCASTVSARNSNMAAFDCARLRRSAAHESV